MNRAALGAGLVMGVVMCDTPHTSAILENASASFVYRAQWQSVTFGDPLAPGTASDPHDALPASANDAYVLLAPGWDPSSTTPPSKLIVLHSRAGYALHADQTVRITVNDDAFEGNCAIGSTLSREEADFITQRIFPDVFANATYDPSTCTTSP